METHQKNRQQYARFSTRRAALRVSVEIVMSSTQRFIPGGSGSPHSPLYQLAMTVLIVLAILVALWVVGIMIEASQTPSPAHMALRALATTT